MDEQLLRALENIGIELVLKKLDAFALQRIKVINQGFGDKPLFEESERSHFAVEAFTRAYDTDYEGRDWNGQIDPVAHICGVIKSIIYNEAKKRTKLIQPESVGVVMNLLEPDDPESKLIKLEPDPLLKAKFQKIENGINDLKRDDDDLINDIYYAMLEWQVTKPRDIAEFHTISIDAAKKYKKRIVRVISNNY